MDSRDMCSEMASSLAFSSSASPSSSQSSGMGKQSSGLELTALDTSKMLAAHDDGRAGVASHSAVGGSTEAGSTEVVAKAAVMMAMVAMMATVMATVKMATVSAEAAPGSGESWASSTSSIRNGIAAGNGIAPEN